MYPSNLINVLNQKPLNLKLLIVQENFLIKHVFIFQISINELSK